mgnify:FL=1|jgi:hypothetical protein
MIFLGMPPHLIPLFGLCKTHNYNRPDMFYTRLFHPHYPGLLLELSLTQAIGLFSKRFICLSSD